MVCLVVKDNDDLVRFRVLNNIAILISFCATSGNLEYHKKNHKNAPASSLFHFLIDFLPNQLSHNLYLNGKLEYQQKS